MTSSKSTKRALLTSVLALLMCVTMLVGATFAWFTDTASTAVNKIQAGNLDIAVEYTLDGETWNDAKDAEDIFAKDALWEPGHVEYVNLKVSNLGNLALTYKLGINIASEKKGVNVAGDSFKLSDSLEYAVVDGLKTYTKDSDGRAEAVADAKAGSKALTEAYNGTGNLYPDTKKDTDHPATKDVTLIVYMPETVGNEANYDGQEEHQPFIDMGINLVATQVPYESDSFDDQYDKGLLQVDNASELSKAVTEAGDGDTIVMTKDITSKTNVFTLAENKSLTLDLNGKTLTGTGKGAVIDVKDKGVLNLENGTINMTNYNTRGIELEDNGTAYLNNVNVKSELVALFSIGNNTKFDIRNSRIEANMHCAIYHNGSNAPTHITVKNSTLKSNTTAVYISNTSDKAKQTLLIDDSTITGTTAVEVKHTNATIRNSVLTGTATPTGSGSNNNGTCTDGYAFAVTTNGVNDLATGNCVVENTKLYNGNVSTGAPNGYYFVYKMASGFKTVINGQNVSDFNTYLH